MNSFGFSHPFSAKYLDSITEPGFFALGRLRRLVSLALTLLLSTQAHALTLRELLDASANTHPTVRAARFQSDAGGDSVAVAKRQYWPTLSVEVESKKAIEGGSRLFRIEQTLWNGGAHGRHCQGC